MCNQSSTQDRDRQRVALAPMSISEELRFPGMPEIERLSQTRDVVSAALDAALKISEELRDVLDQLEPDFAGRIEADRRDSQRSRQ